MVGDKIVTELTHDDGIDYTEWWRDRVTADEVEAKTTIRNLLRSGPMGSLPVQKIDHPGSVRGALNWSSLI